MFRLSLGRAWHPGRGRLCQGAASGLCLLKFSALSKARLRSDTCVGAHPDSPPNERGRYKIAPHFPAVLLLTDRGVCRLLSETFSAYISTYRKASPCYICVGTWWPCSGFSKSHTQTPCKMLA